MSVFIATGSDHPYLAKAETYLASLRKHEPARSWVFTVDFEPGQDIGLSHRFIDFSKCVQNEKKMLQTGAFVLAAPPEWRDDDVIAFTDADMILARPLTKDELDYMEHGCRGMGVMIGRNKPDPTQTLVDEASVIGNPDSRPKLPSIFPGCERFLCRNTGFVVAKLRTWRELYAAFVRWWPTVDKHFWHYAKTQWLLSFLVQHDKRFTLGDVDLTVHAHAHHSIPPGVEIGADGIARYNGEVIAFRHAL